MSALARSSMSATAALSLLNAEGVKRNRAAVAILRIAASGEGTSELYAWQRKTPGYPAECMVGALCLFGGNYETGDLSAKDTLIRELQEELPADWAKEAVATLKPFGRYVIQCPPGTWRNTGPPICFVACIFEAFLPSAVAEAKSESVEEGKLELLTKSQLLEELGDGGPRFCWAYDTPFEDYLCSLGESLRHGSEKTEEVRLQRQCLCSATRLDADAEVGDWEKGSETWR
eukprot:TRINITY_DN116154_c0_g1_i1.p1 TRINITY_DN116154_c0_g1~~TRINITY_DN116154_c0_g1_i1.p1  ORF type:complete len:251 (+),score=43.81 TRINITY_DN116154_c0_g1_i1:61-753(+)